MNITLQIVVIIFLFIISIILTLFILFNIYCKPKIKKVYTVDFINNNCNTGDLILVSPSYGGLRYDKLSKISRFFGMTDFVNRLFAKGKEWNHVAIFVKINNEPYVYDTVPYNPDWIEYDFTLNKYKDSGFIKLSRYIESFNGYIGIRKLKYSIDNSKLLDIIYNHNLNMKFSGNTGHYIYHKKQDIKTLKYNYNCCQAVASIYHDAGIKNNKLNTSVLLEPYTEENSDIFSDILHIQYGSKLDPVIRKYFPS